MQEEFQEILSMLSENAQFALQKANISSRKYGSSDVGTEHLLVGILNQRMSSGARLLSHEGIELESIERILQENSDKAAIDEDDLAGENMAMMALSNAIIFTFRMAKRIACEYNSDVIGTEHILWALTTQKNSRAALILANLGLKPIEFAKTVKKFIADQAGYEEKKAKRSQFSHHPNLKWLAKYGQDLTEMARQNKLDAVIGRDNEIERTVTILCRRTKSNPVLIGEAGVGKTAIVEGLATRIVKGQVPSHLIGKRIYQVDLSNVVAGSRFRGDFEERIKGIITEAVNDDSIILFIDELHLLCGAGAGSGEGAMDAANILKPALARGKICLIGATTLDEYRKNIEKDKALSRRFQTVIVNEPSPEVTLQILKGIKKHYENHHGVKIPDDILETAINMSSRYINDRFMPDKVIDVIDEAAAIAKVADDKKDGGRYRKLKIEEAELGEDMEAAVEREDYEKAALCKTRLSQISKDIKELEKRGANKEKTIVLTEENLALAVSLKTGIPVSKVHGSELKMLTNLEAHLKKSIIGQDEAIAKVAKAIRRGRSGIANSNRPIGSFIFMGPTGVGKTELARVIAREVFGGEDALIKIDMSEFGEKHNVSRLVGAPAGYVGYDDGGKLTEAVRRRPYSVVLFDEIEKAHPDVFNMLLQILEDGVLTDGQGNKIKFNNTIVILTSNLGSQDMYRESELGFVAKTAKDKKALAEEYEENKASAMRALQKSMRPELINRLDAILVFHALTHKDVEKIFDNLIDDLKKRLAHKSIGLKITDNVKKWLIKQGFDPKNGARPLRRAIEDNLESLLSEFIISGDLDTGDTASVDVVKGRLKLEKSHE